MAFRFLSAVLLAGCVSAVSTPDGEHDIALRDGDIDALDACAVAETLAWVNAPTTTAAAMKERGVHARAAVNLEDAHAGPDGRLDTGDDQVFSDLYDVDAVAYVGPVAMDQLLAIGGGRCAGRPEPVRPATCPADEVLAFVNAPTTASDDLREIGVHSLAATNLVAVRDGADGLPGTEDDVAFASMEEVDAVPQVGPVTMETLLAWGAARCGTAGVVFSPQPYDASHIFRVEALIDASEQSIDVAMYSFRDTRLLRALQRAVDRGVTVRFLFDGAAEDRRDPEGSRSAQLEDMGIEVRWVNKIQHHKFAIFDGPRDDLAAASTGVLATGSGNWSYGAATRFDENMLVTEGDARLMLLFQREFDLLWENSRDFVWNEDIAPIHGVAVPEDAIASASGSEAVFTSANFRTYESAAHGPTFARDGDRGVVRDALVDFIAGAERSVWIASGHLRSRQITDAIVAKAAEGVDVRVYLDGQEYTSAGYFAAEVADYRACLATASTDGQVAACHDDGLHFGLAVHAAGVPLRYKTYAYRWDYHYADQMHHKYVIVDGEAVATGSYNFSNNAEHDTFENVVFIDADRHPEVVAAFQANFLDIWDTGEGLYDELMEEITHGDGDVPLVFAPMALDWDAITSLKAAIRAACPAADSAEYREDPPAHLVCPR